MPATPHTPGSNGSNKMSSSPSQQQPHMLPMPSQCGGSMNNNINCNANNMYNMNSYGPHHNVMQHPQQNMMGGDYMAQNYQDQGDFGNVAAGEFGNAGGAMRQDFSLDDLNFDPAYMMDNNCSDDLAVRGPAVASSDNCEAISKIWRKKRPC